MLYIFTNCQQLLVHIIYIIFPYIVVSTEHMPDILKEKNVPISCPIGVALSSQFQEAFMKETTCMISYIFSLYFNIYNTLQLYDMISTFLLQLNYKLLIF